MTRARDIADLVDANGDIVAGALDNVPASNDASALTTGTLAAARLPTTGVDASSLSTGTLNRGRLPAGSILQIVSTTDNIRRKYTGIANSTWLSNYNNLDTSITPLSSSSKLMFFVNIHYGCDSGTGGGSIFWRIKEGGSVHSTLNGDSNQSFPSFSQDRWGHANSDMQYHTRTASINGIQISNSTTTARTYSIEFRIQSPSRDVSVNRDGSDSSDSNQGNHSPTLSSNMTIIEVAT